MLPKTIVLVAAVFSQMRVEPAQIGRELVGKRIIVEGVYSASFRKGDQTRLQLKGCPKVWFLPGERSLDAFRGNIEITGDVRYTNDELVVQVVAIRALPDDLTQYQERRDKIADGDHAAWTRLADWAAERAKLYPNTALAEQAIIAYRTAFAIERKAAAGNANRLEELERRSEKLRPSIGADTEDIAHEALRARFREVDASNAQPLRAFAAVVQQRLRGSDEPSGEALNVGLRQLYDENPIVIFQRANAATRRQIVRYWEVSLLHRAQQIAFEKGDLDGLAAYELATKEMPDYPEFAREWLERAVKDLESRPADFPVRSAEALATLVRDQWKDRERSARLLLEWLERREGRILDEERTTSENAKKRGLAPPARNAQERFELATLYLKWLDGPRAVNEASGLLAEVLEIDPTFSQAEALLRKMGYTKGADGQWILGAATTTIGDPGLTSITAVRTGMTQEEVRRSIGDPSVRARLITKAGVTHQWVYRLNQHTVYVFFQESGGGAPRVSFSKRSTP